MSNHSNFREASMEKNSSLLGKKAAFYVMDNGDGIILDMLCLYHTSCCSHKVYTTQTTIQLF